LTEKAVEGFMLGLVSGAVFEVKGLIHPPGMVVAYPRYVSAGDGKLVKVYPWAERFRLLKGPFRAYVRLDPVLGDEYCEVPWRDVARLFDPVEALGELRERCALDPVEADAVELAELLKEEAGIPWRALGLTGSIMLGLHGQGSDVDLVVYGREEARKAHEALKCLMSSGALRPYGLEELRRLHALRSTDTPMDFETFARVERRKVIQGLFRGREYFMRFVVSREPEPYGAVRFSRAGRATIRATVVSDEEAIFTPCSYGITDVEVLEGPEFEPIRAICSFRGRFCEHARPGERVVAKGKLELVVEPGRGAWYRLVVGNEPGDFFVPVLRDASSPR